jgi:hypothetical protein
VVHLKFSSSLLVDGAVIVFCVLFGLEILSRTIHEGNKNLLQHLLQSCNMSLQQMSTNHAANNDGIE